MKRTLAILLLLAISLGAQQMHFMAVDIYVDSQDPLAAYQLEFTGRGMQVRIAGIEGGAHEAFKAPPFYDPKAMQQERVILAAFNTSGQSIANRQDPHRHRPPRIRRTAAAHFLRQAPHSLGFERK